jgi:hypothetical protein
MIELLIKKPRDLVNISSSQNELSKCRWYLRVLASIGLINKEEWECKEFKAFKIVSNNKTISNIEFIDLLFGEEFPILCSAYKEEFIMPVFIKVKELLTKCDQLLNKKMHEIMALENPCIKFEQDWIRNCIRATMVAKGFLNIDICQVYESVTVSIFVDHVSGIQKSELLSWLPEKEIAAYAELKTHYQEMLKIMAHFRNQVEASMIGNKLVLTFE